MKMEDRTQGRGEVRAAEARGDPCTDFHWDGVRRTLKDWAAPGRIERLSLFGILILGCALRLGHFWAVSDAAFLKSPLVAAQSDQYAFWQWAQTILAGDLLGRNTYHPYFGWMRDIASLETWYRWWGGKEIFHQAPLYPYFVAGLLKLSKNSLGVVILVQLLVGTLHPMVVFWLAKRLFDGRVGLVAAALTAFYGPFIFHQGLLLRDWLLPILEPLAVVALLKGRENDRSLNWLLAGAALGLCILTKETILLFLPFVLLWILLEYRWAFRKAGAAAAMLLLGLMVSLSPLAVRNRIVGAPLLAISPQGGWSFIIGNAADAFPVGPFLTPSLGEILLRSDGRIWAAIRETLRSYQGDWPAFIGQQLLKLRGLVDPLEVANNAGFSYGLEISPALWFTLRYGIIFPLGMAGFFLSLKVWRRHLLLLLYGLSTVGAMMVTTILARYRLVLVPILIVYAAAGLMWLFEPIRTEQRDRAKIYLTLLLGLAVVQHLLLPLRILRDLPDYAIHSYDYFISAEIYASEGRPDRAVAEMERLQDKAGQRPSFAGVGSEAGLYEGNYRVQWAEQLIREGNRDEARRQMEMAWTTYKHLNLSAPNLTLGNLYLKLDEPETAKRFFERFLELEPQGPRADEVRRILDRLEPRTQ